MEEVNTINNIASENVDFSMFALFMSADLVVKSVIIILILCGKILSHTLKKKVHQNFPNIFLV